MSQIPLEQSSSGEGGGGGGGRGFCDSNPSFQQGKAAVKGAREREVSFSLTLRLFIVETLKQLLFHLLVRSTRNCFLPNLPLAHANTYIHRGHVPFVCMYVCMNAADGVAEKSGSLRASPCPAGSPLECVFLQTSAAEQKKRPIPYSSPSSSHYCAVNADLGR